MMQPVANTQRPTTHDRELWIIYWESIGQPWRTEPEIEEARQQYLEYRRTVAVDVFKGIYPFAQIALSRADVEWLIATHVAYAATGDSLGGTSLHDPNLRIRQGLDLRAADLRGADLHRLPLVQVRGGLSSEEWPKATLEQRQTAAVHLEGADLTLADLRGAALRFAHLDGANLYNAHLEGVTLRSADLSGADLRLAYFDENTTLTDAVLGDSNRKCARLADARWGGVNLATIAWHHVRVLGDEIIARNKQQVSSSLTPGRGQSTLNQLALTEAAVRANRQLSKVLREQGINEEADRFAYRAHILQRKVFWRKRQLSKYLLSLFLDGIAGFGYRPGRSVALYVLTIFIFAVAYYAHNVNPFNVALVVSLTAFHGRGFFPSAFKPTDPIALMAALEALIGLIIEVSFIATFTERFFHK